MLAHVAELVKGWCRACRSGVYREGPMLDVIIRGGQVVTPDGVGLWDVGIQGERIVAVAAPGTLPADGVRTIDAGGKLVLPGGVDPHVHTAWPVPARGGELSLSAPPGPVSR